MKTGDNIRLCVGVIVLLWAVFFLDLFLPVDFSRWAVVPRNLSRLPGIFVTPMVHGGLFHLALNSSALFVLLFLSLMYSRRLTLYALFTIVVLGGLGVWCFGSPGTVHVGASGVIFGLIGWLLFGGVFRRDLRSVFFSVVACFLYGGSLLSIFRYSPGISWSGHFFGLVAGVVAARIFSRERP